MTHQDPSFKSASARIISLFSKSDPAPFLYPACRDLEAYWTGLRPQQHPHHALQQDLPNRADFDPRGVEATLPHVFLAEAVTERVLRLRVAGSAIADMIGLSAQGMPLSVFIDPVHRETFADLVKDACTDPAILRLELRNARSGGADHDTARMILLPMRDETGAVTRFVGCLEMPPIKAGLLCGRKSGPFHIARVEKQKLETGSVTGRRAPQRPLSLVSGSERAKPKATTPRAAFVQDPLRFHDGPLQSARQAARRQNTGATQNGDTKAGKRSGETSYLRLVVSNP